MQNADEVRAALADVFAVNPLSGGDGRSIESPVIIHRGVPNDVVGTEYAFISTSLGAALRWETVSQSLATNSVGQTVDCLEINTPSGGQTFYFDVTDAIGR